MTKATAAITDKFKGTYVRITDDEQFARIQELMFKMGFKYRYAGRNAHSISLPKYLFVDENCEMGYTHRERLEEAGSAYQDFFQIGEDFVAQSAEQVRKIKREEHKASKKRAAKRAWEATATKKTHDGCPVHPELIVSYKQRDGNVYTTQAKNLWWGECGIVSIESYKVIGFPPKKPASKVVSLDEMFAGIATGLGKGAAVAVGGEVPADMVFTPEPAYAPVGDVNSNARGSGARFNSGKPDYSLIPMSLLEGEARVWAYGARKYKAWNWMKGMDWNVPFACAMRHMAAWQRGEDIDPETGESHLDHAMCNLRMLRYYADYYKEGDNRPKEFFNVQAVE